MQRVTLKSGPSLSRLAYGVWRLADDSDVSAQHIRNKIAACLDQGITTIDHADIYGGYVVEEMFGAALKGSSLLDRVEIVTKCGIVAPVGHFASATCKHYNTSAGHIQAAVDRSLRLLGVQKIDLLLIHRPDPFMDYAETGAALDGLIKSGKILSAGVSNFRPWDFAALQAAMHAPLVTNQIEIGLQAPACFTNGDIADLQMRGLPPMAWSPLGGGSVMKDQGALGKLLDALASGHGVDRSAIAIAWLLAHPAGIMPVIGTNDLGRLAKACQATRVQLRREDWFRLYEAAVGAPVP